jgi:hypothetical protein
MDEFEAITRNPNFDASFFSFLRALANSYRVAYVTSSCDELQLMCHNKDISDSPFFNIFSNLPLRPFAPKEALLLISKPSAAEGVPLQQHSAKILELAGYFPLFVQIVCASIFENIMDDPNQPPDWPQISQAFQEEAHPHFEFAWQRMSDLEKENLCRLATGAKLNRKYEFVNEALLRRGFLVEKEGVLALFSQAFQHFVLVQQQSAVTKTSFMAKLFSSRARRRWPGAGEQGSPDKTRG